MADTLEARQQRMESYLSRRAGVPVEMTIRDVDAFTFSTEGDHVDQLQRLADIFPAPAKLSAEYCPDCDLSVLFVDNVKQ